MTGDQTHEPALRRLKQLGGYTGGAVEVPDWAALEDAFGHGFPTDFKAYVEAFPPGVFGMVRVFHPLEKEYLPDPQRYVDYILRRNEDANDLDDFPPFGAQPGELFAWGTVNGEFELCWELSAGHPDKWTCVVADVRCQEWERYGGGMLGLLLDVLGGSGRVSSLDDLREILPMRFTAKT